MTTLTKDNLARGMSSRGGWSRKQIASLGENQTVAGWRGRLRGKQVPLEDYERFLALKDAHLKGKQPDRLQRGSPAKSAIALRVMKMRNALRDAGLDVPSDDALLILAKS